ncbi:MAG: DUF4870 domain-containing protein [Akkermansiaceae bacterium]
MEPIDSIETSKEEKTWAMFAHLSSFLGWIGLPLANIIAPLVIWQIKKDEMPFAAAQAKECLNFQISMTIYALICGVLCIIIIGFFGLAALFITDIILTIIASIKANEGVHYRYPMTIRFIK